GLVRLGGRLVDGLGHVGDRLRGRGRRRGVLRQGVVAADLVAGLVAETAALPGLGGKDRAAAVVVFRLAVVVRRRLAVDLVGPDDLVAGVRRQRAVVLGGQRVDRLALVVVHRVRRGRGRDVLRQRVVARDFVAELEAVGGSGLVRRRADRLALV